MATGFYVPDGRDFSSIFTAGNAGFTSGFKQANGQDLGNIFQAGNLNLATGYKISDNTDMGNKLGATVAWSNNANTCQVLTKKDGKEITNNHLKNVALGIQDNYTSKRGAFFLKFNRAITLTYVNIVFSDSPSFLTVDAYNPSKERVIGDYKIRTWTGSIQNCTGIRVDFVGLTHPDPETSTATINQFIASGYYTG